MFAQKNKSDKLAFHDQIVRTFGKLDESDIEKIDGQSERLMAMLRDHYGWSTIDSQARVDRFMKRLID